MRRRRLTAFLVLSALLHGVALLALFGLGSDNAPHATALHPVTLELRFPKLGRAKEPPASTVRRTERRPSEPPSPEPPRLDNPSLAPRAAQEPAPTPELTSLSARALAGLAPVPREAVRREDPVPKDGPGPIDGAADAGERARAHVTEVWREHNSVASGPRGSLVEVGHALREKFRPHPALEHTERSHVEHILLQWANELTPGKRTHPGVAIREELGPKVRDEWDIIARQVGACIAAISGNCGQKHEIARMTAFVRLEHDAQGRPQSARIAEPSGVQEFDRYCLESASGFADLRLKRLPGDPLPEWSIWRFVQIVYRFNRAEQLLDPVFRLPGLRDSARSDLFGATSITTDVAVVAARFR